LTGVRWYFIVVFICISLVTGNWALFHTLATHMASLQKYIFESLAYEGENSSICHDMDESWGHYIKWKKSVIGRQITVWYVVPLIRNI
jgi:hypothetical protein